MSKTKVDWNDLDLAFEFASGGAPFEHQAYLCLETGRTYLKSDDIDPDLEELPEDLEDSDRYVKIPDKHEFGLDARLVRGFASHHMPEQYEAVERIFRRRGAYRRFKALLDRQGMLDAWYAYEARTKEQALLEWCEEVGVEPDNPPASQDSDQSRDEDDAAGVAIHAAEAPARAVSSSYPRIFAEKMQGRDKRPLGDLFKLRNFGVNLTRLAPGAMSALRHAHAVQDEFVYVLEGRPTLVTGAGRTTLGPGMCAGFAAGSGDAHHLINDTRQDVVYLEIGDRLDGDAVSYPDDDLQAVKDADGRWRFLHKDGRPY